MPRDGVSSSTGCSGTDRRSMLIGTFGSGSRSTRARSGEAQNDRDRGQPRGGRGTPPRPVPGRSSCISTRSTCSLVEVIVDNADFESPRSFVPGLTPALNRSPTSAPTNVASVGDSRRTSGPGALLQPVAPSYRASAPGGPAAKSSSTIVPPTASHPSAGSRGGSSPGSLACPRRRAPAGRTARAR